MLSQANELARTEARTTCQDSTAQWGWWVDLVRRGVGPDPVCRAHSRSQPLPSPWQHRTCARGHAPQLLKAFHDVVSCREHQCFQKNSIFFSMPRTSAPRFTACFGVNALINHILSHPDTRRRAFCVADQHCQAVQCSMQEGLKAREERTRQRQWCPLGSWPCWQ
jgi:hypothetical protein